MEHEEWTLLSAFVDRALSPHEAKAVEAHLASCADCRAETESLRALKARLSAAPRHALPADLAAAVETRVLRPTFAERLSEAFVPARVLVPAGAFAVLAVFVWAFSGEKDVPLEPLLAAHSRYSVESLVSQDDLSHPEFLADLSDLNGG